MKRKLSWGFAILAYLAPALWCYNAVKEYEASQRLCGMPILAMVCLACLAAATLSIVATVLGTLSFRSLKPPRPKYRYVELLSLAAPCVIGLGYTLAVICA